MPYKSGAQRRWAHTKTGVKALGGRSKVAEWDSASKGLKLPERAGQSKYRAEGGIVEHHDDPDLPPLQDDARLEPQINTPQIINQLVHNQRMLDDPNFFYRQDRERAPPPTLPGSPRTLNNQRIQRQRRGTPDDGIEELWDVSSHGIHASRPRIRHLDDGGGDGGTGDAGGGQGCGGSGCAACGSGGDACGAGACGACSCGGSCGCSASACGGTGAGACSGAAAGVGGGCGDSAGVGTGAGVGAADAGGLGAGLGAGFGAAAAAAGAEGTEGQGQEGGGRGGGQAGFGAFGAEGQTGIAGALGGAMGCALGAQTGNVGNVGNVGSVGNVGGGRGGAPGYGGVGSVGATGMFGTAGACQTAAAFAGGYYGTGGPGIAGGALGAEVGGSYCANSGLGYGCTGAPGTSAFGAEADAGGGGTSGIGNAGASFGAGFGGTSGYASSGTTVASGLSGGQGGQDDSQDVGGGRGGGGRGGGGPSVSPGGALSTSDFTGALSDLAAATVASDARAAEGLGGRGGEEGTGVGGTGTAGGTESVGAAPATTSTAAAEPSTSVAAAAADEPAATTDQTQDEGSKGGGRAAAPAAEPVALDVAAKGDKATVTGMPAMDQITGMPAVATPTQQTPVSSLTSLANTGWASQFGDPGYGYGPGLSGAQSGLGLTGTAGIGLGVAPGTFAATDIDPGFGFTGTPTGHQSQAPGLAGLGAIGGQAPGTAQIGGGEPVGGWSAGIGNYGQTAGLGVAEGEKSGFNAVTDAIEQENMAERGYPTMGAPPPASPFGNPTTPGTFGPDDRSVVNPGLPASQGAYQTISGLAPAVQAAEPLAGAIESQGFSPAAAAGPGIGNYTGETQTGLSLGNIGAAGMGSWTDAMTGAVESQGYTPGGFEGRGGSFGGRGGTGSWGDQTPATPAAGPSYEQDVAPAIGAPPADFDPTMAPPAVPAIAPPADRDPDLSRTGGLFGLIGEARAATLDPYVGTQHEEQTIDPTTVVSPPPQMAPPPVTPQVAPPPVNPFSIGPFPGLFAPSPGLVGISPAQAQAVSNPFGSISEPTDMPATPTNTMSLAETYGYNDPQAQADRAAAIQAALAGLKGGDQFASPTSVGQDFSDLSTVATPGPSSMGLDFSDLSTVATPAPGLAEQQGGKGDRGAVTADRGLAPGVASPSLAATDLSTFDPGSLATVGSIESQGYDPTASYAPVAEAPTMAQDLSTLSGGRGVFGTITPGFEPPAVEYAPNQVSNTQLGALPGANIAAAMAARGAAAEKAANLGASNVVGADLEALADRSVTPDPGFVSPAVTGQPSYAPGQVSSEPLGGLTQTAGPTPTSIGLDYSDLSEVATPAPGLAEQQGGKGDRGQTTADRGLAPGVASPSLAATDLSTFDPGSLATVGAIESQGYDPSVSYAPTVSSIGQDYSDLAATPSAADMAPGLAAPGAVAPALTGVPDPGSVVTTDRGALTAAMFGDMRGGQPGTFGPGAPQGGLTGFVGVAPAVAAPSTTTDLTGAIESQGQPGSLTGAIESQGTLGDLTPAVNVAAKGDRDTDRDLAQGRAAPVTPVTNQPLAQLGMPWAPGRGSPGKDNDLGPMGGAIESQGYPGEPQTETPTPTVTPTVTLDPEVLSPTPMDPRSQTFSRTQQPALPPNVLTPSPPPPVVPTPPVDPRDRTQQPAPPSAQPTPSTTPAAIPGLGPPPGATPVGGLGGPEMGNEWQPTPQEQQAQQAQQIRRQVGSDPASFAQVMQAVPGIMAGLQQQFTPDQINQMFGEIGFSRKEENPALPEDKTLKLDTGQQTAFGAPMAQGGFVDQPGYYAPGGGLTQASMRSLATQAHYSGSNVKPAIKPPGVHLISSSVPGRTDRIPMRSAPGSFVLPADVVSGVGQGNTQAGAKMWGDLIAAKVGPAGIANVMRRAAVRQPTLGMAGLGRVSRSRGFAHGGIGHNRGPSMHDDLVPIVVAGGEVLVDPEFVCELGDGDPERGKKVLSDSVMTVRKHVIKHLQKLPRPVD